VPATGQPTTTEIRYVVTIEPQNWISRLDDLACPAGISFDLPIESAERHRFSRGDPDVDGIGSTQAPPHRRLAYLSAGAATERDHGRSGKQRVDVRTYSWQRHTGSCQ